MEGLNLIKKGVRVFIGDSQETKIWTDAWLLLNLRRPPEPKTGIIITDVAVKELFIEGTHIWNRELVDELFEEEDARVVKAIRLSSQDKRTCWVRIILTLVCTMLYRGITYIQV